MKDFEKLTKQAYRLYFWAREEARCNRTYSVRRERLVLLASWAFARYERRVDLEYYQNREITPPQETCQVYKPVISRHE